MLVSVRPHPDWGWDPAPAAPVRVHSLAARADLNSQTGTLLSFDEPPGRGCLRLNGAGGESVRINGIAQPRSRRSIDIVELVHQSARSSVAPRPHVVWMVLCTNLERAHLALLVPRR